EIGRDVLLRAADELDRFLLRGGSEQMRAVAEQIVDAADIYIIGGGLNDPTALEAALKIKEVSYAHAEGFAGGELKHGVIALLSPGTPCVVYAPNDETRADIISGAMELKSRDGYIIGVSPANDPVFDVHIPVPDVGDASPLVNALPPKMLGYHAALLRGNDPDKPRNLAKSVTVKGFCQFGSIPTPISATRCLILIVTMWFGPRKSSAFSAWSTSDTNLPAGHRGLRSL